MLQLINETKTDYLTNLPNRKAFDEDIIFRIDKLKKNEIPALQLIVIDLKNLKKINDNEGMEAGDKIIIKMASNFGKFNILNLKDNLIELVETNSLFYKTISYKRTICICILSAKQLLKFHITLDGHG